MHKLRRVDLTKRSEIFEQIALYTQEVVKRFDPSLVLLFGSFAAGDIHEGSDVDILVVADFEENFLDRITALMKANHWRLPLEPVGYTQEEIDDMKRKRNPFILDVMERGRILYQRQH